MRSCVSARDSRSVHARALRDGHGTRSRRAEEAEPEDVNPRRVATVGQPERGEQVAP
jgi:hypothetical protein